MKSKTVKSFINFKMNDEVYKSRRKVINFIYELKNEGFKLPRVDVRIGKSTRCNVLAKAKLKENIIWVTQKAIDTSEDTLRSTVFHELLHAIYGQEHVRNCPIMSASQYIPVDKTKAIEIFRKYYNKYN